MQSETRILISDDLVVTSEYLQLKFWTLNNEEELIFLFQVSTILYHDFAVACRNVLENLNSKSPFETTEITTRGLKLKLSFDLNGGEANITLDKVTLNTKEFVILVTILPNLMQTSLRINDELNELINSNIEFLQDLSQDLRIEMLEKWACCLSEGMIYNKASEKVFIQINATVIAALLELRTLG